MLQRQLVRAPASLEGNLLPEGVKLSVSGASESWTGTRKPPSPFLPALVTLDTGHRNQKSRLLVLPAAYQTQ